MVPQPFRVLGKRRDTEDTWTLELEPAAGGAAAAFDPGQFNMLYAFGAGEVPISISGDPGGGPLTHTVRSVGAATAAICEASAGDVLGVRGPFGSAWPLASAEGRDLVVIAGGIGLAPLRPALVAALGAGGRFRRVVLLYGGRTPEQLLYRDELERWGAAGELEMVVTVDSASGDWHGRVGVVTRLLDEAALEPAATVAMLCGPEVMMRFTIEALGRLGVDAADIHLSIERNMKCAITQCGRCQFGPTFACREGPVMRLADIAPFFAVREV